MQRLDIEYDIDTIKRLLSIDLLSRNKNLEVMMKFLNNLENQMVLNLDDDWGTGKTVFLKQLEYLGEFEETNTNISDIDPDVIIEFKSKYTTFYFNAWEHDIYDDPLESLIYSLLMKMAEVEDSGKIQQQTLKTITTMLKKIGILAIDVGVKTITSGSVELSDLAELVQEDDNEPPILEITSIEMKRNTINELLEELLGSSDKKLLIIVDELDRCKPSYAVRLLEVIKHFFVNDATVFLFGSNKKELSETVKHEYGQNFNGYKYLNRFFDLEFTLPKIKESEYIKFRLGSPINSAFDYLVSVSVCKYFDFSMRDINKYCTLCNLLKGYFRMEDDFFEKRVVIKYLLLLYAIGARIDDINRFNRFINGNGFDELIQFYESDKQLHDRMILRFLSADVVATEELKKVYQLINLSEAELAELRHRDDVYAVKEMLEVLTMMSNKI